MLRLLSVLVDGIFRFYVEQHINLALNFQPFFMGYPPLPLEITLICDRVRIEKVGLKSQE